MDKIQPLNIKAIKCIMMPPLINEFLVTFRPSPLATKPTTTPHGSLKRKSCLSPSMTLRSIQCEIWAAYP